MISAEGRSETNDAVGSYGSLSSSPGAGSGTLPDTTPWNQCHSAPPRWSTSPAGVQPDGTTDRCHASSSRPATIDRTAARWAARKASRAWSSAPWFGLLVMAILWVVVIGAAARDATVTGWAATRGCCGFQPAGWLAPP